MEKNLIGDYNFIPEVLPAEGKITMVLKPIDLISYWRRCGVTSNFIANFYRSTSISDKDENSISTIFNELIENAAKYSTKKDSEIIIDISQFNTVIAMQVKNTCSKTHYLALKNRLEKLLNCKDLEQLYIDEMTKEIENRKGSGIGLLLILKDYNIKIGAKLEEKNDEGYETTIQVYYQMEREETL